jgi:hypothetical protein
MVGDHYEVKVDGEWFPLTRLTTWSRPMAVPTSALRDKKAATRACYTASSSRRRDESAPPWAVVLARKEQAMLRADAQRAVIREWLALPADQRKTKEQAVAYAMTAVDRFKFRYKGDRYQLIQVWLFKYVGLP